MEKLQMVYFENSLFHYSLLILFFFFKSHKSLDNFHDTNEGRRYFGDLGQSIMSLIILLTTANNPDGIFYLIISFSHKFNSQWSLRVNNKI